jgi:hypothetical protein
VAALQNPGFGDAQIGKSANAFRHRCFSGIEPRNEPATELVNLCEGMRLATFIGNCEHGSLLDPDGVRLEVPVRIGRSSSRFREEVVESGKGPKGNVVAEVGTKNCIEASGIALVESDDLGDVRNAGSDLLCASAVVEAKARQPART